MSIKLYKRLAGFLIPYKGRVLITILTSIVVGVLATSPVPLIQRTFDDIFINKDFFMLKVIPLALIGIYLVKGVLSYIQNLIIFRIGWELVSSLRQKLFNHIHKLPYGFFEVDTTGQLISRVIYDVDTMLLSITRLVKEFLQNVVMLVGLIFWLFYLKWDWAIFAMIIFPLAIVPTQMIARKLRRLGHHGQELLADISSTILESFAGIKIVRAFALENQERDKFKKFNDLFLQVKKKDVKYTEITSPFMEILGVSSGALILWYGGYQVLTGAVSQGIFIGFIVAIFMLYGPVRLLFKIYTSGQTALASAERVFSILDLKPEHHEDGNLKMAPFKDSIQYQNVSFKYPSRNAQVLDEINLTVNKSDVLAIVGMSGAGKTTLVDLLFKFFSVTDGKILIDGVDINDISSKSLRDQLALVTQETFLFNDTIIANVAFGNPNASKEEILLAMNAAHVDSFVQTLDDGYDTVIGERGIKLSGGQRQRIAIARAILRNAPILVLDEATSALDSESEKLVQDALHRLMEHRTTFVIAHRLSTIKNANKIIVLEHGKIVGVGSHDELMNSCDVYQRYYEIQVMGS